MSYLLRLVRAGGLLLALVLGIVSPSHLSAAPASAPQHAITAGQQAGVMVGDDQALVLSPNAAQAPAIFGAYTRYGEQIAPAQRADVPFRTLHVDYSATLPEGSAVLIDVRGSYDGQRWTSWEIDLRRDSTVTFDRPVLMAQYRAILLSDGPSPRLHGVALTPQREAAPFRAFAEARSPVAPTYKVHATRQGMVGGRTANGHIIKQRDHFVSLPSRRSLSSKGGSEYMVRITANGRTSVAPVYDIGPWNINDNYWDAERVKYTDLERGYPEDHAAYFDGYNGGWAEKGKVSFPTAIDIGDGAWWDDLGLAGARGVVEVTFLWLGSDPLAPPPTETPVPPTATPEPPPEPPAEAAPPPAPPEPSAPMSETASPTPETATPPPPPQSTATPEPPPNEAPPEPPPPEPVTPAPQPEAATPAPQPTAEAAPPPEATPASEPTAEATAEVPAAPEPPAEATPAQEPPASEPPAEAAPAPEATPAPETPAEATPAPEPPAEAAPAPEATPAPETPAEATPAPEPPAEATPAPQPVVVDDRDGGFKGRAKVKWYSADCGNAGRALWTYSTPNRAEAENYGRWQPELTAEALYDVYAFVPDCPRDRPTTASAGYLVQHRDGSQLVTVDQAAAAGQWVLLGRFPFAAGSSGSVELSDVTADAMHTLWYDAVKWVPAE